MIQEQLTIRQADIEDVNEIGFLANEIWPKVYDYMISPEQIRYMLNLFYTPEALYRQMFEQYHIFFLAELDEVTVGFASVGKIEEGIFRLHKLYVQPELHGKGVGKALVEAVLDEAFEGGGRKLQLTVNKNNKSLSFYQRLGFTITGEQKLDIGSGYFMDDYIMEREIS
jgi:ribosomal protein S18 acetylase RimI-like enzyme